MEVQADITTNVKYRLSEYKNRLAVHQMKMPEHDLMLHLNPQVCYKGEQAPDGTGPWPEEMTHYFCASRDLVDWCLKDYKLYQTTEKVYPLTNGRDLHVSVTCYRIRLFNRYLDDVNIPICVIALIMSTYIFHSWLARWRNPQGEDSNGNSPAHTPSPPTSPPPPPSKKKTINPAAPHPKLRSRHENYRSRR
uniref:CX domain-containing protein n=1 Tax=Caenorhabditis tropicalis TaxID=1561998 RepID=A0A1I7TT98_9PELO